jgi:LPS-assembly protein
MRRGKFYAPPRALFLPPPCGEVGGAHRRDDGWGARWRNARTVFVEASPHPPPLCGVDRPAWGAVRIALLAVIGLLFATYANAAETLRTREGDNILLQANEVVYDIDNQIITARGKVEIDYGGRILLADSVSYNQKTDTVTANGHVSITAPNGDVAFANRVVLHDKMRDGALQGFAALIGKNGRMVASSAKRTAGRFTEALNAAYTPCKVCAKKGQRTPLWQVKSYRVVYDQVRHKIEFRDATLEFFGVPVFYTPYYSQPDPTVKHSSGILSPVVGTSTTLGSFVKVPVYVSLSDSQDLTIEPWLTARNGQVLEGEYRQRFSNGGFWVQTSVAHNPNGGIDADEAQTYAHLFGSGKLQLNDHWHVGFDAQLAVNDTYLKRYDISSEDRLTNDIYVESYAGRSRFAVTGYFFEGLRATDNSRTIPFVLPLVEYTFIPERDILGGQFRFDFNTVSLAREDPTNVLGTNDQRLTAEVRYRIPYITPNGQMISLTADARGDVYHTDPANPLGIPGLPGSPKFISRGIPYVALDWRWPFISGVSRSTSFVIEPIMQGILQPYGGNPIGIPNEDSTSFEFSDANLFSFDRTPGYDIVESGPRLNAGLRAAAIFDGGEIEALLGQAFRPKRDNQFTVQSGLNRTVSNLVGRFDVKLPPYLDVTERFQVDESTGSIERNEVYATGTLGRSSARISYVRLPQDASLGLPAREEVNAQAIVGLFDHWALLAAADRDLKNGKLLDTELGGGYEDECLNISIAYRRRYTSDRDVPPSTSIILRFNLKTGDQPIGSYDLFPEDVFALHP